MANLHPLVLFSNNSKISSYLDRNKKGAHAVAWSLDNIVIGIEIEEITFLILIWHLLSKLLQISCKQKLGLEFQEEDTDK